MGGGRVVATGAETDVVVGGVVVVVVVVVMVAELCTLVPRACGRMPIEPIRGGECFIASYCCSRASARVSLLLVVEFDGLVGGGKEEGEEGSGCGRFRVLLITECMSDFAGVLYFDKTLLSVISDFLEYSYFEKTTLLSVISWVFAAPRKRKIRAHEQTKSNQIQEWNFFLDGKPRRQT